MAMQILYLEDNPLDVELVSETLLAEDIDFELSTASDKKHFIEEISVKQFDVILSDYSLIDFTGSEALEIALKIAPDTPFILVSGVVGEEFAIDSLKQGATDYILKQRLSRLAPCIERALKESKHEEEKRHIQRAFYYRTKELESSVKTLEKEKEISEQYYTSVFLELSKKLEVLSSNKDLINYMDSEGSLALIQSFSNYSALLKDLELTCKMTNRLNTADLFSMESIVNPIREKIRAVSSADINATAVDIELPKELFEVVIRNLTSCVVASAKTKEILVTIMAKKEVDKYEFIIVTSDPEVGAGAINKTPISPKSLKVYDELSSNVLGLTISERIVSHYGGQIWCVIGDNGCYQFTFDWPYGNSEP